MFEYIPDSIVVELLVRLPLTSLIKFRRVSKSWRDLINTRYVAEMHSKIIAFNGSIDQVYAIAIDSIDDKATAMATKLSSPAMDSPKLKLPYPQYVVGSCHGILCLYRECHHRTYKNDLALWSPFYGSYLVLPALPRDFTLDGSHSRVGAAFGYDHINDDYKVVKFYHGNSAGSRLYELCVYSLKQNSLKTMRSGIPFEMPGSYFFTRDCAVANGAVHWLVCKEFIVAFDLATCEFRKLSCCANAEDPNSMKMFSLNGCLALKCDFREFVVSDIWMMEKYGVGSSWKKMVVNFELERYIPETYTPVVFLEGRRKLVWEVRGKLVVYDDDEKSFSEVVMRC